MDVVSLLQARVCKIFQLRKYSQVQVCNEPLYQFSAAVQKKRKTSKGDTVVKSSSKVSKKKQEPVIVSEHDEIKQRMIKEIHDLMDVDLVSDSSHADTTNNVNDRDLASLMEKIHSKLPVVICKATFIPYEPKNSKGFDILPSHSNNNNNNNNKDKKDDVDKHWIWVVFHRGNNSTKSSISIDHVRQYILFCEKNNISQLFIISAKPLTRTGDLELEQFKIKQQKESKVFSWECFSIDEVLRDIENHVLVPDHIILTEEEKQQELKKHSVEYESLIDIETDDAMAKILNLKPGMMIRMITKCGIGNGSESQTFRKCSDPVSNTIEMSS